MLFASGARKPEYGAAIALFLSRNSRKNPDQFLSALPRMVSKHKHLAGLIASREFELEGWSAETRKALSTASDDVGPVKKPLTVRDRLLVGLVLSILLLVLLSCIVGFVTMATTIWAALTV
ncbi:hypothetical protein IFT84_14945 [Rhizobium sp. CFBP 8762]|uniref:hypothetical protein n=1 Tax=Rhizobium sp. CFBP 8762 TaxID=2775279 RepID=UPI0017807867|nr:hypothetical protein [Rhizobium sp. CFBP 8762]MBD8555803.1 hypothetical protein [Rhizobium sp. CFBP 8762]